MPYILVVILGSFLGYVISGYINGWLGRRLTFMIFAVCSAILIFLYVHIPAGVNVLLLVLGVPLGFLPRAFSVGLVPTWPSCFLVGRVEPDKALSITLAAV